MIPRFRCVKIQAKPPIKYVLLAIHVWFPASVLPSPQKLPVRDNCICNIQDGEESPAVKLSVLVLHWWHPTGIADKLYFWKTPANRRDFRINNRPLFLSFLAVPLFPLDEAVAEVAETSPPAKNNMGLCSWAAWSGLHSAPQTNSIPAIPEPSSEHLGSWILPQTLLLLITGTFTLVLAHFLSNLSATSLYHALRTAGHDFYQFYFIYIYIYVYMESHH